MNFKKNYLAPQYLCIVDIGSYKIRVSICKFLNKRVTILWYREKRQDTNNFINQECLNIVELSENIDEIIKKLEKESSVQIEQIVVNFPFGELFVATKKVNYKRDLPHSSIKKEELEKIIMRAETLGLKSLSGEILDKTGLWKNDLELVLSRMNHIKIDGEVKERILWEEWENIRISLLNIFVPLGKYNLINHLGNIIEKKIIKILPTEFCVTKLFEKKSLVILNIGATQTSIIMKKENEVVGVSKIGIGINDLLSRIAARSHETKISILEKLDTPELYEEEKKYFVDIWNDGILVGLKDILWEVHCPREFFIMGWGGINTFIKDALQKLPFEKEDIRVITPLHFVELQASDFMKNIIDTDFQILQMLNLDTLALILETNNLLSKEKDVVSESLKKVVQWLGYNLA